MTAQLSNVLPFNNEGVFLSKDGKGSWLQTGSGGRVSVLDPRPEEFRLDDIARATAKLCRFNGHCIDFYSVAQHCVLGAKFALKNISYFVAKEFLLHDATEAYVGDMIRPVKIMIPEFGVVEDRFTVAIGKKFNTPTKMSPECHLIDNIMVTWEKRDLLPNSEAWPRLPDISIYNFPTLRCWGWRKAEREYLKMYERLFNGKGANT
jgi:hypothetical protein